MRPRVHYTSGCLTRHSVQWTRTKHTYFMYVAEAMQKLLLEAQSMRAYLHQSEVPPKSDGALLHPPLPKLTPQHLRRHLQVPVYVSSLFLWPIYGQAAEPQFGGPRYRGASRVQAATLYLEAVQAYLRGGLPFWNVSGGRDHVWAVLHDEGPCYVPRTIRNSILLTHYGYHTTRPCAWTTYKDDDWYAAAVTLCHRIAAPYVRPKQ